MQFGREPGCCFKCQYCVDHGISMGISGGGAYAAANAIRIWLRRCIADVVRPCIDSSCRDLRNVATRVVVRSAEWLMVAKVKLRSVQDARLGCPKLSQQSAWTFRKVTPLMKGYIMT